MTSFIPQVIEELRKLKAYIEKETGEPSNITGVGLASRKHLCINPEVRERVSMRQCFSIKKEKEMATFFEFMFL